MPTEQPLIPDADPLLILSLVVVGGLLAGRLARMMRIAGVTGQILLGVAIGHTGLYVFAEQDVARLAPVTGFAIGLIAVAVGGHLNLRRLGGARKRLGMLLAAEATITPIIVFTAAWLLGGANWETSLLLSALAVSTAPATIVALVTEMRAKGVFTKTLLGAVALNNLAAILLFEVAHLAARVGLAPDFEPGALEFLLAPLRQLLFSAALGGVLGAGLVLITRHVVRTEALATASVLCVLLTTGLADLLGLSTLLSCLFLGVTLANLTPDKDEIVESAFVNVRDAIFAVFFTLAGMHLDLNALVAAGTLVVVVFFARVLGKISAGQVALRWAGATANVRRHLGEALLPQAGVAVGLLLIVTDDPLMEPISGPLLAVGLAVVAANELVGPFMLRSALVRTGDAGRDRDRILDFLHEENIVVDLKARTKEQAIEQLVDVLIRTNHLDADRARLLDSVISREREVSTCFGQGLAVPHGVLESGDRIVGAMGLSQDGLDLDAPDGKQVHCMVVLATPPGERERHLEVLGALAKAVGHDRNLRRQLYHSATPAHAYELLHAEDAEEFNYFLED